MDLGLECRYYGFKSATNDVHRISSEDQDEYQRQEDKRRTSEANKTVDLKGPPFNAAVRQLVYIVITSIGMQNAKE